MLKKIISFYKRNKESMLTSIIAGLVTAALIGIPYIFSEPFRAIVGAVLLYKLFEFQVYHLFILGILILMLIKLVKKAYAGNIDKDIVKKLGELNSIKDSLLNIEKAVSEKEKLLSDMSNRLYEKEEHYERLTEESKELQQIVEKKTQKPSAPPEQDDEETQYFKSVNKQLYIFKKYLQDEMDNKRQYTSYDNMLPFINKHITKYASVINDLLSKIYKKEIQKDITLSNESVLREASPHKKDTRICQRITGEMKKITRLREVINKYLKEGNRIEKDILKKDIESRWIEL